MSQMQIHDSEKLTRRAGAVEPSQRQVIQVGDALAFTSDVVPEGRPQTNFIRVRSENQQLIAAEVWTIGQDVYWHEAGQVITTAETDAKIGFATRNAPDLDDATNQAKKTAETSAWVSANSQSRLRNMVSTIDFGWTIGGVVNALGLIAGGPGADGRYTLRNYATEPRPVAFMSELVISHDGALTPGAATIQLGTQADPDAFWGPITITNILLIGGANLLHTVALPGAPVAISTSEVVLTVTVADVTAGRLNIKLVNTALI